MWVNAHPLPGKHGCIHISSTITNLCLFGKFLAVILKGFAGCINYRKIEKLSTMFQTYAPSSAVEKARQ
jgi:outer membrane murein-binding lipoprotein Lpp